MGTGGFGLILSFSGLYPTSPEEHAFVHGVEFGELWCRMASGSEAEIEKSVHAANRVIIERSAVSQGWTVEFAPTEFSEWVNVRLRKAAPARQNPHGFRIVDSN